MDSVEEQDLKEKCIAYILWLAYIPYDEQSKKVVNRRQKLDARGLCLQVGVKDQILEGEQIEEGSVIAVANSFF